MRRFVTFLASAALILSSQLPAAGSWSLAAGGRQHRYESVEPHMGTLVRITLYAADADEARTAFQAAFARIRALDGTLSDYQPESELNRVAAAATGTAVRASGDLIRVLAASQALAEASGGAFDVTQGAVVRLWREARASGRVPDEAALREASSRSGYRHLHVDPVAGTVRIDRPGLRLDVGAIGKGYTASEALAVLTARGVRSALVAVSGDLAFSDAPPGTRGWRINIHGEVSGTDIPAVVELANAAVSTAGASEQHLDAGGRRYSHIVDPATRAGLTEDITVTVVARNGLDADGLDTTISVLGVEKGMALIESRPDAAALIVRRTSRGVEVLPSSRLRDLLSRSRGFGLQPEGMPRP